MDTKEFAGMDTKETTELEDDSRWIFELAPLSGPGFTQVGFAVRLVVADEAITFHVAFLVAEFMICYMRKAL